MVYIYIVHIYSITNISRNVSWNVWVSSSRRSFWLSGRSEFSPAPMARKFLAPCSPSWCPRAEGCLPRPANVTVWSLNFTDFTDGLRKNHPCFHRFFDEININQPSSELGGSTIYGSTQIFLGLNFTGCSTNIHKWDDPNNSGVRGLAFHSDVLLRTLSDRTPETVPSESSVIASDMAWHAEAPKTWATLRSSHVSPLHCCFLFPSFHFSHLFY